MSEPPNQTEALLLKHRNRPLVLDANLLVLLLVGAVDRRLILTFKRTSAFIPEDYDVVCELVRRSSQVICTPNVLTEVSNLLGDAHPAQKAEFHEALKAFEAGTKESYHRTRLVIDDPDCSTLGVSDSVLLRLCDRGYLLVTADLDLHIAALHRSGDCINFNHIREIAW